MEIIIKGKTPTDPRDRILAIEAAAQAICKNVGEDAADGVMMLLTAAVHISMKHSKKPLNHMVLAESLGCAIAAAEGFFTLRMVDE